MKLLEALFALNRRTGSAYVCASGMEEELTAIGTTSAVDSHLSW